MYHKENFAFMRELRYFCLFAVITLFGLCDFEAYADSHFTGSWNGSISLGAQKLPIVFNITDEAITLDSPAQNAKGIPAEYTVEGDTISVKVPMIGAYYKGLYANDEINGTFSQNGIKLSLVLNRGEYVPPRPQTPQQPFAYQTKEVTIVNPVDGTVLNGTLALPVQYYIKPKKQFPAVVMVTGSGIQNRDEEIFSHKPFAVLAHNLAINGIASLRCDDRGFNDKNAAKDATTAVFASDAAAALAYMRDSVERISSVGVIGHSEGGTIAFMLAADGKADFIVSLAGSAVRGDSLLLTQNRNLLGQAFNDMVVDDYCTALGRVFDYMKNNPEANDWPELEAETTDLKYIPSDLMANLHQIIKSRNTWMDYFLQYDPTPSLERISVPVLALNGELDMQVDAKQNLSAIENHVNKDVDLTIRSYPELNHLLQHAQTGFPAEYGTIDETISPEVIADIVKWITKTTSYYSLVNTL